MKCQRQIARIRWQDHIRNAEVTTLTGLSPVSESIIRRRNSLFGQVTRLAEDTPAHQALHTGDKRLLLFRSLLLFSDLLLNHSRLLNCKLSVTVQAYTKLLLKYQFVSFSP